MHVGIAADHAVFAMKKQLAQLLREFGQAYADYKSVTPMLIPGLKLGGNK